MSVDEIRPITAGRAAAEGIDCTSSFAVCPVRDHAVVRRDGSVWLLGRESRELVARRWWPERWLDHREVLLSWDDRALIALDIESGARRVLFGAPPAEEPPRGGEIAGDPE